VLHDSWNEGSSLRAPTENRLEAEMKTCRSYSILSSLLSQLTLHKVDMMRNGKNDLRSGLG
jgi:hypothetical protein